MHILYVVIVGSWIIHEKYDLLEKEGIDWLANPYCDSLRINFFTEEWD